MSNTWNVGYIEFNKSISEEAVEAYKKHIISNGLDDSLIDKFVASDGSRIELEEFYHSDISSLLEDLVEAIAPLGYEVDADISYYGSCDGDGSVYAEKNVVSRYLVEDRWQRCATVEELVKVIESRGYSVKIEKSA